MRDDPQIWFVMNGDIVDSAQVRRAALFLVNIGVPVIKAGAESRQR
jgi:hypothetical protein